MKRERGTALLLAIATMGTVAFVVSGQLLQAQHDLALARNAQDLSQARWIARAGVDWARVVLEEDARTSTLDSLQEAWAVPLPALPAEGGEISGQVVDQQGLFNLANLRRGEHIDPDALEGLRRLLQLLDMPSTLADAIARWPATDTAPPQAGDAALTPALAELVQLRAVPGVNAAVLERLRPYLSVLPARTRLNVNTAPVELLCALTRLGLDEGATLAARRAARPFAQLSEFMDALPPHARRPSENEITTNSEYFQVRVRVKYHHTHSASRVLVHRPSGSASRVLARSFE